MVIENKLYTFDDVKNVYKKYISNSEDLKLIKKAYEFALKKHEGQFRKSGDPYISHCINVAMILAELGTGPKTICAGFLHDVVEDTSTTIEEIIKEFSIEVAQLVEALTKVTRLSDYHNDEFTYENHRKIFVAMAKDVRVILIKLADRLHNMRTLQFQPKEKQIRISKETVEVYAPIAHRLGLNSIQTEFEDLALYYLDRPKYRLIEKKLDALIKNSKNIIDEIQNNLSQVLSSSNIEYTITHRVKSIYSIYKKMFIKNYSFEQIYDYIAFRIITQTTQNCYELLGYIHSSFKPVPGRFKDYIAMPKANMYQSLHTTVVTQNGDFFEVQIRTNAMDLLAENGVAAHWRYKEGNKYDAKKEQIEIENQLHWFKELISFVETNEDDKNVDVVNSLSHDIFDSNVYVFTPKGNVICLPSGSTPIDFAYKIHSEIGDHLSGAKVNGQIVPISYKLSTGDIVEVTTNKNQSPNSEWLNYVQTNVAKNRIKKFLIKQNNEYLKEDRIKQTKQVLIDYLREKNIRYNLEKIIDNSVLEYFEVSNLEELCNLINKKSLNPTIVFDHSKIYNEIIEKINESKLNKNNFLNNKITNSSNIICLPNGDTILSSIANCCLPVYGEEIIGFVSSNQGVKIHRKDCPNINKKEIKERLLDVIWNPNITTNKEFPVDLIIICQDRNNLLSDIINILNLNNAKITKISAKKQINSQNTSVNITIYVKNKTSLDFYISLIYKVKSVLKVNRSIH